jgi:protein-L-isoaspartate(D-aspartate) O-methyltransferase
MALELVDSYKHKGMRKSLVRKLKAKGIENERVLTSIGKIPRHWFFDEIFVEHAYQDKAFPIAEGQTISQPYTVAFQTALLDAKPGKKVLEIGTGSGYQAAVLVECGVELVTIEYKKNLSLQAQKMLDYMDYHPECIIGDGSLGLEAQGPYDGIIVTAGAPTVPNALIEQLKIGGCLVIPVGDREKQMMLKLTKKSEDNIVKEEFSHFSFVPLLGNDGWNN